MKTKQLYVAVTLALLSLDLHADPFTTCPSKAFLVQESVAKLYGVNLATGSNAVLSDNLGTTGKINGLGFNLHDRYLYGWGYDAATIVKIGNDFQMIPLAVANTPASTNFYVGDVSVQQNYYYSYRKGASYGLYRTDLDESSSDYLIMNLVVSGDLLNLNIFDLAFHPDADSNPNADRAYSVDSNGNLHKITIQKDGSTAVSTNLGNVGVSGTFGAVYFDVDGNFYISRNSDGHVFRIDVSAASPNATLFAYGPSSSNNDGARCATAPIIDEDDTTIDFGDAPTSYGISLADNGARHEFDENGIFLGDIVNGEPVPKSTDDSDDGVQFVTALEAGLDSLIIVKASKEGYLNAWFDWDNNGKFDDTQAISQHLLVEGLNAILVDIPSNAFVGDTWSRFRVSKTADIGSIGGVSDGEVEDYPISISDPGITSISYPGANDWVALAYEDLWPEKGDYDFNDVVVNYRTTTDLVGSDVVRFTVEGTLNAVGASYHNGFAVRLDSILSSNINEDLIRYEINGVQQTSSAIEPGRSEAIIIVMADTKSWFETSASCTYFRTQSGCENSPKVSFKVTVPLITPVASESAPSALFDPFIFAVNGFYHGPFVDVNNARSWEVHLKNQSPTEAFAISYGQADDNSGSEMYYQTAQGLPWALEIGVNWSHPKEGVDLLSAYPDFAEFTQSSGSEKTTWFNTFSESKVINN
ncbi:LruC domain-containing protein [Pseudoalteromonas porphyrae]|uniref:Uncharacterized protein n=1 Tax=Pseudoalteromonas porphyrae TaxID=187330 RepID=A0A0N1MUV1_9GAMM|nr:LruC domain-containing protein [Pseudoalteromonas porphyrae]KPH65406.1 hypothetical protein ADS77_00220 [Pseudoalteromonas porphyrae]